MSLQSLRVRYSVPLILSIVTMIVLVFLNNHLTKQLNQELEAVNSDFLPAVNAVLNADRDLYQARLAEYQYAYDNNPSARTEYLASYQENTQQAYDRYHTFARLMAPYIPTMVAKKDYQTAYTGYVNAANQVFQYTNRNQRQQALQHANITSESAFKALRELYDTAGELAINIAEQRRKDEQDRSTQLTWGVNGIAFILIISIAIITYLSPKLLVRRIQQLTESLKDISAGNGDLTVKLQVTREDELGELAQSFNNFVDKLRNIVIDIRQQSQSLYDNTTQLTTNISATCDAADQQHRSADMIASAVHETSIATKEVAQIANQTASDSQNTITSTEQGVEVVNTAVNGIKTLSNRFAESAAAAKSLQRDSEEIASVLDVIREIAEQTNLLALNAAIEAARAGEQGRGFAVVADEVRTLANRTQQSTDTINQNIVKLQQGVDHVADSIESGCELLDGSVQHTQSVQTTLENIRQVVTRLNDWSIQTATATEEQTQVAEDINRNLQELNSLSEEGVELATRNSQITEALNHSTRNLEASVGQFKV